MFKMIENYLYMSHTDQFVVLPVFPEQISDSLSATFSSATPLSRSAPIYSYSNSGPRTIQVSLKLHRDMMSQVNTGVSNLNLDIGDDYIDTMLKQLQAIALPKYEASMKMVDPPTVSVRFGNEIYIHGVVNGGITITYSGPLSEDNKYKIVDISFNVSEIDPYDAMSVQTNGSFRGMSTTLERRLWRT